MTLPALSQDTALAAAAALRRSADEWDQLAARHDKMSNDQGYTTATIQWADTARITARKTADELRALARSVVASAV